MVLCISKSYLQAPNILVHAAVRCAATSAPAHRTKNQNLLPAQQPGSMHEPMRTSSQPARTCRTNQSQAPPTSSHNTPSPSISGNTSVTSLVPRLAMSAVRSASAAPSMQSNRSNTPRDSARNCDSACDSARSMSSRTTVDYSNANSAASSPRLPSPPPSSCPSPVAEISLVATGGDQPLAVQSPQQTNPDDAIPSPPPFECAPHQPLPHVCGASYGATHVPPLAVGPRSFGRDTPAKFASHWEQGFMQPSSRNPAYPQQKLRSGGAPVDTNAVNAMYSRDSVASSMSSVSCISREPSQALSACDSQKNVPQQRRMLVREHHSDSGSMLRIRASQSARSVAQPSTLSGRVQQGVSEDGSRTPRQRAREEWRAGRAKSAHTAGSQAKTTMSGYAAHALIVPVLIKRG